MSGKNKCTNNLFEINNKVWKCYQNEIKYIILKMKATNILRTKEHKWSEGHELPDTTNILRT